MNCREFNESLQQWLDGEAELAAVLQQHGKDCPPCREVLAAAQLLEDGLRARIIPLPPRDLAERVARQVVRDRRRTRQRNWWLGGALAASLAAVLFWGGKELLQPNRQPDAVVKVDSNATEARPPSIREHLRDAGKATVNLTRSVARDTANRASMLVPNTDIFAPALNVLEPPDLPLDEAGRTVATGFEPVTTSAKRAWNMLVKELPTLENTKMTP